MKTYREIEDLKFQWICDPVWDIETTEGFEDHKEELFKYRMQCESKWKEEWKENMEKKAHKMGVPGNIKLAEYIENLEMKIERLQEQSK